MQFDEANASNSNKYLQHHGGHLNSQQAPSEFRKERSFLKHVRYAIVPLSKIEVTHIWN